jgi:hypothetical protein
VSPDAHARRAAHVGVAVALFLVLLWASTSASVRIWHSPDAPTEVGPRERPTATSDVELVTVPPTTPTSGDAKASRILDTILLGLLLAALVAIIPLLRRAFSLRWNRERREREIATLPDIADTVTAGAVAQLSALGEGAPRNAIVACWIRLEDAVAAAGLEPNPAETAAELTARVLSTYGVARTAIVELASLYREARFSTHELGEEHRERAVAALRQLHSELAVRTPAVPSDVHAT